MKPLRKVAILHERQISFGSQVLGNDGGDPMKNSLSGVLKSGLAGDWKPLGRLQKSRISFTESQPAKKWQFRFTTKLLGCAPPVSYIFGKTAYLWRKWYFVGKFRICTVGRPLVDVKCSGSLSNLAPVYGTSMPQSLCQRSLFEADP